MMKIYFTSLVVLLVVCSKHVILTVKNEPASHVDKLALRSTTETNEHTGLRGTNLDRGEDANIAPTTYRSVRVSSTSSSGQERDTKLMNLLAARRSALNRDRFRTHRRISTTGRTQPPTEATSKAPLDLRTICVRNCTKNFTRRTTASCMRQCTALQRLANATSTSNNTSEEDKSQKDNNEILFTDESSHGFFVVAKHINDTVNHIPDPKKVAGMVVGNSFKPRQITKSNATAIVSDSDAYLFFGRKVPSLRPSFLSISTVNEERPRVLEVSVSEAPIRPQSPLKHIQRERTNAHFTRKTNTGKSATFSSSRTNPIKQNTSPENIQISKPIESKLSEAQIFNDTIGIQSNESIHVEENQTYAKLGLIVAEDITSTQLIDSDNYTTETVEPEMSTPLIISVSDDTTVYSDNEMEHSTEPTALTDENSTTEIAKIEPPQHFSDDKANLIIFVNKTTEIVTQSSFNFSPEETVNATEETTLLKTTILSSVRSTVYPLITTVNSLEILEPKLIPIYSVSESSPKNRTSFLKNNNENNTKWDETSSRLPEEKEISSATRRLNLATYVLAGLGMFPIIIVIIYLAKSLILKSYLKHDEDFDVCITDQQPISPVKKPDNQEEGDDGVHYEKCSISSMDEFNRANLRLKSLLGEGNFGQVWKAEADDLSGHFGATRIVAVKTVRSGSSQCGLREEAAVMRKLGSHPNVVTLLGACIENEPHMLIMEFAMRGRLLSLLRAARSATNMLPASVPGGRSLAPLSPRTLAGFALDIATGMEYIAEKRIVHRDLAARNVLIDHNGVCKICDFGMSIDLDVTRKKSRKQSADLMQRNSNKFDKLKFDLGERFINNWNHGFGNHTAKKHHETLAKRPALPIRWMAPEALQFDEFSTETDVFAFGIVLWEIATLGATPYANLSGREVVRCVLQGTRPELPKDGRQGFFDLMSHCWHKVPELRPTFREARLEISRSVCKWIDDDTAASDYMDVSGFSEDLEHGMLYFNQRISEFECEI